ncbi:Disease resistance-responsive (dirigent-like protein) family protein [Hibiscus syriacus]|uniref:Dirigent protein n=1 Tax=Hibiscus syriacus TaxID=106335 RepID=A0A6A2YAS3_HIBSY|nr:Disease resistance-responsive (dirigent-like protein) family protein [Hibiscus syriacus]
MEKLVIPLLMILLVAMQMVDCVEEGAKEVEEWFDKLPYAKQKVTKLHFFFHDRFAGKHNITAVRVAHGPDIDKSPTSFDLVFIMDDPLTEGMKPTTKELGRAQGPTLTVLGRNPAVAHREMPIVGGSGVFRLARGVASAQLRSFNMTTGDALIEYNVVPPPETIIGDNGEISVNDAFEDFVAQDMWATVQQLFANRSTTAAMSLHYKLQSLKKGNDNMRVYLTRVKEVCNVLAS